ncbi:MAG: hypothetical protein ACPGUY_07155 [Akkermansiaceae bacterium]
MKLKPIIFTGLVATLLMSGINFIQGEETLVPEDGKVAATKLPLDQKQPKSNTKPPKYP